MFKGVEMNYQYLVKIENMTEESVKAFQSIANNHEHLREALSSDPEETFEMMKEEIKEIECHVESRSGMILGFIKSVYPDAMPELFTRLHQNLIDASGTETRVVIHIFEENYQYYASYLLKSSDDGVSTTHDSCILDHHEVHEHVITKSEGIMEIQAEVYEDLNIELDKEDWDWEDVIYPDPSRIMQSAVYYDFFYDNALSVFQSLQEELEEDWEFNE
jgi:hypothetical protein